MSNTKLLKVYMLMDFSKKEGRVISLHAGPSSAMTERHRMPKYKALLRAIPKDIRARIRQEEAIEKFEKTFPILQKTVKGMIEHDGKYVKQLTGLDKILADMESE